MATIAPTIPKEATTRISRSPTSGIGSNSCDANSTTMALTTASQTTNVGPRDRWRELDISAVGRRLLIGASCPFIAARAASAERAASSPLIPWTPPPGGVDDEHRYSPAPTRYGSSDGHGRKTSWRMSSIPPLMSPPT